MKIYELLKVPYSSTIESDQNEAESIDFYTELSVAMYRVEKYLLTDVERIVWEFDEWGNLEAYSLIQETKQDGAPDCNTWLYVARYAGYIIKTINVIN